MQLHKPTQQRQGRSWVRSGYAAFRDVSIVPIRITDKDYSIKGALSASVAGRSVMNSSQGALAQSSMLLGHAADSNCCRCGPCTRLGFECDYNSIWRPPNTQINKPCRRQHPSRAVELGRVSFSDLTPCDPDHVSPTRRETGFVISVQEDVDKQAMPGLDNILSGISCGHFSPSISYLSLTNTFQPADEPACSKYLSYYTEHLSKLLVMADTASNPLRETIIPRMLRSPTLLKAVCAVSACHLSQRGDNFYAARDGMLALRYYSSALNSLTASLNDDALLGQVSAEVTLLTAAFLCKYEIIRGSTSEWRHHLKGLMQLVKKLVTSAALSSEVRKYLQSL